MKKTLIALAALSFIGAAMAQTGNADKVKEPLTFEIGATVHNELYEEWDMSGGKIMQEEGVMYGLKAVVTGQVSKQGKIIFTGELAQGESTYTGSFIGGTYGSLSFDGLSRKMVNVTGTYAHTFPSMRDTTFTGGLGYRQLTDNLQEAGNGGYKRINDMTYAIVGVEHAFRTQNWTITPGLNYKHLISGEQFSDLIGGITVKQNNGSGSDLYVAFQHKSTAFVVTPYLRTWSIGDSEIDATGLYEPRNKTREVGVAVSYRF